MMIVGVYTNINCFHDLFAAACNRCIGACIGDHSGDGDP